MLHGFLYWGKCPTNDIGNGLCHLPDILYDMFYITIRQHWYTIYRHGNMGRNCVKVGNGSRVTKTGGLGDTYASAKRSAVLDRGKIPLHM